MSSRWPLVVGLALLGLGGLGLIGLLRPHQGTPLASPPAMAAPRSLSQRLAPNEVAVAVRFDHLGGLAGSLRPGDRIDVYAVFPARRTGEQVSTRLLLRERTVFGAAQETTGQVVSLGMTPEDALVLHQSAQLGSRPFAALRPAQSWATAPGPSALDDRDLAAAVAAPATLELDGIVR